MLFAVLILNVYAQAVHIDQIYWIILFLPFMRKGEEGNRYYEIEERKAPALPEGFAANRN